MSKKIKVFHEAPFSIMNFVQQYTDGEYCLPHLLDHNETYLNYFYKAKTEGRYIIMDNSLHELGTAYNNERLLHWINKLKPNEFIIPDVWEDKIQSVINARSWINTQLPEEVIKVAVIQAKSMTEAIECYQTYKDLGYKKIAFSYGASYYNLFSSHPNKDMGKALGRIELISKLYKNQIISSTDKVHLLGCSVPQEFSWYTNMPFIESIDTSNPVMAGIEGKIYGISGLTNKPISNMNEVQNDVFDKEIIDIIHTNITMFKMINNL